MVKVIPHSPEAEMAVIGIILVGKSSAFETVCSQTSTEGLFYDERHKEIWNRVERIVGQGKPVTLRAVKSTIVEFTLEEGYVDQIESDGLPESCLPNFITELLEYRQRRSAMMIAEELSLASQAKERKISEVLDSAESELFKCRFTIEKADTVRDIVHAALNDWEVAAQQPNTRTGIETGFDDFDQLTWGLQPGTLTIIAARPSQGKTALLCNFAENVVMERKVPTLLFSLEMGRKEIVKRLICSAAKQDSSQLRAGVQRELSSITRVSGQLSKAPLIIEDRTSTTITQMRSLCRRHVARNGVKMILVDYLQKVKPSARSEKRTYEVGQVSEGLKDIAKECGVPVVAACQLNRDSDKEKPRAPRLSDLGDSGMIERDADIIACLYRRPKEEQTDNDALLYSLLVQKHRDGPTGSVRLRFFKEYTRFEGFARIEKEQENEFPL